MLTHLNNYNRDIRETLDQQKGECLEDDIFIAMDKLDALCAVQAQMEAGEGWVSVQIRAHYVMIIEEHVQHLRRLLTDHFG